MIGLLSRISLEPFSDGGKNCPESRETLLAQQSQLVAGLRPAQMFPRNTPELPLPDGFERVAVDRGVFHFNPSIISRYTVCRLSAAERENALLALGPYSKADLIKRRSAGEPFFAVTERTPDGLEVKAVAGVQSTLPLQIASLEATKSPGNVVRVEPIENVLMCRSARRAA